MKNLLALLGLSVLCWMTPVCAQNTAFTYQGRLNVSGNPANGRYDLIFKVFDTASAGSSIGGSVVTNNVPVTNGLVIVEMDFGSSPFNGLARWLQIQVSTNGRARVGPGMQENEVTSCDFVSRLVGNASHDHYSETGLEVCRGIADAGVAFGCRQIGIRCRSRAPRTRVKGTPKRLARSSSDIVPSIESSAGVQCLPAK